MSTSRAVPRSQLYTGRVVHQRLAPRGHRFRYAVAYLGIDLDQAPRALDAGWLCGYRRPALVRFTRGDYFGRREVDLAATARAEVARQLGRACPGPVELVTTLRSAGYSFNPVSFYLCRDAEHRPAALLAEITNTPWRERAVYAMPLDGPGPWHHRFAKRFHVSPFMPMQQEYRWTVTQDRRGLAIGMRIVQDARLVFTASLALARHPWRRRNLRRHLLAAPLAPVLTIVRIHYQALRLWCKRTPVHPHPRLRGDPRHRPLLGAPR